MGIHINIYLFPNNVFISRNFPEFLSSLLEFLNLQLYNLPMKISSACRITIQGYDLLNLPN